MFEASAFTNWVSEMGCAVHYITPEMHHSNGQAERYVRTVLNLIRVESNNKKSTWSDALCKIQIMLNITKQKTTQYSALYLLIGTNATTPIIHALVRDVAMENSSPNREATREISRSNAKAALDKNRIGQDTRVNRQRHTPKKFQVNDQVFVIKYSQSGGKLYSGMRGPYRVTRILPNDRYEMKLLSGSKGKTIQAAAQYMVLWNGEWCPESCSAFLTITLTMTMLVKLQTDQQIPLVQTHHHKWATSKNLLQLPTPPKSITSVCPRTAHGQERPY
ncbi:uncharacterized protein LOC106713478 [Papilio machaon]|uniref:uncharacterized protein LOC106713478 n=1 Tax=Papilio machaon TaxID=76193 RepID=UPI001E6630CC|nr:uncharacterized protein LOC106713478 [Papilio machaon]